MKRAGLLLWPPMITLGLVSESVAYGWGRPLLWVPDLAVGLLWCPVALRLWPSRRAAAVLALALGITWFFGGLAPVAVFWHRGPLVHLLLLLAFAGRPRVAIAATIAYGAALVPAVWRSEVWTLAFAGALLILAGWHATTAARTTLSRTAQSSLIVTCLVLMAGAVTRLVAPGAESGALPTLLAYEATLAGVALVLIATGGSTPADSVADQVLELNDGPASSLRDALAEVLDDPDLLVGYWRDHLRGYTDLEGREVPPNPGGGRTALPISYDGRPVALVLHDAALLGDPRLTGAVEVATRLATANADLRARVTERRSELAASRRRLVRSADEERADLASLLRVGPRARLVGLLDELRTLPHAQADVETATKHVISTIEDLDRWERGLHPLGLDAGLQPALEALCSTSAVPVTLDFSADRFPGALETAVYYVCAEGLANLGKHARAHRAVVTVQTHAQHVLFEVVDDGIGGADSDSGTGLVGVRDRVEAFGGTMTVTSDAGRGTRLSGTLPLSPVDVRRSW